MTTIQDTKDIGYAESFRQFADWLDENPEIEKLITPSTFYIFSDSEEEFREVNRNLGSFTKGSSNHYLDATKKFGRLRIQSTINKELTCEKRVTGTKMVRTVVPMEDVEMVEIEVEEEIVEWLCPETWR